MSNDEGDVDDELTTTVVSTRSAELVYRDNGVMVGKRLRRKRDFHVRCFDSTVAQRL